MEFNFDFNYVAAGAPIVTFSKLGLAFNSLSRELLGYPEKVMIGYDRINKVLGVIAADDNTKNKTYEFEIKERNGWVRIGCKTFMTNLSKELGLDLLHESIQFVAEFVEENKMLIVKIREEKINK